MSAGYTLRLDRRTTLQWLGTAMLASGIPTSGYAGVATGTGYGFDPDLGKAEGPWPKTMTRDQLDATAALADLILPATKEAPAPSAIGIPDFIDEWVSAPYPTQQADRTAIFAGLAWLDAQSRGQGKRGFTDLDPAGQEKLLALMAPGGRVPASNAFGVMSMYNQESKDLVPIEQKFFRRFRYLVLGAYYTAPEGLKDIGYIGNVALESYPPITDRERSILEEELRKLGI